jgi:hypothetical protein
MGNKKTKDESFFVPLPQFIKQCRHWPSEPGATLLIALLAWTP